MVMVGQVQGLFTHNNVAVLVVMVGQVQGLFTHNNVAVLMVMGTTSARSLYTTLPRKIVGSKNELDVAGE